MKKVLLTLILGVLVAPGIFAQKKVTAISSHSFEENGDIDYIDSMHYSYATYFGSINSNEPWFGVDAMREEIVPLWNWISEIREFQADFTTSERWYGNGYPLTQDFTSTKNYNANNQCTTHDFGYYRVTYTYTTTGKIDSILREEDQMGSWVYDDSYSYKYDAQDRLIVLNEYHEFMGTITHSKTDTLEYDGNSDNVSRSIIYYSQDGINFDPSEEAIISYSNNQPSSLEYYEDEDNDPSTPLDHVFHAEYIFGSSQLNSIDIYPIIQGSPGNTLAGQFIYEYNTDGKLTKRTTTGVIDEEIITIAYDSDNFADSVIYEYLDNNQNFYIDKIQRYYYQNTASIETVLSNTAITLYPNPTRDFVQIESDEEVSEIIVFNGLGQKVLQQRGITAVDLSAFTKGIYTFHVSTPKGVFTRKIVKE
jgi:hypothetical protein